MTDPRTAILTHRCLRVLGAATALLWALGVAVDLGRDALAGSHLGRTILASFELDAEQTIPAWFSSSLLLAGAALWLLGGLRHLQKRTERTLPWFLCAGFAAFLSMDESVGLHERVGNAVDRRMPGIGLDTFAWILPGAALVLVVGVLLIGFLRRQPPLFRLRLVVAACCYFGGAIGLEAIGAWIHAHHGKASFLFAVEVWIEEGLELLGALLWIRALALHLFADDPG